MRKFSIAYLLVIVSALLITAGCDHNSVQPGSVSYPLVAVDVRFPNGDTLYTSATNTMNYGIYVFVRDSVHLNRLQDYPVTVTGRVRVGRSNEANATIAPSSSLSDTASTWGTTREFILSVVPADTGRANFTIKVYAPDNALLKTVTRSEQVVFQTGGGN